MFGGIEVLALARSLSSYSGARQAVLAENVANADTPGYRARDLPAFAEVWAGSPLNDGLKQTRPEHLGSGDFSIPTQPRIVDSGDIAPNGNGVSLEVELVRAADIRSKHNLALSVYSSSLDIIRAAIGRGR